MNLYQSSYVFVIFHHTGDDVDDEKWPFTFYCAQLKKGGESNQILLDDKCLFKLITIWIIYLYYLLYIVSVV